MKFCLFSRSWELQLYVNKREAKCSLLSKMQFANCAALVAVLFTTLIENLRLCSSAEAGIVLNLF